MREIEPGEVDAVFEPFRVMGYPSAFQVGTKRNGHIFTVSVLSENNLDGQKVRVKLSVFKEHGHERG